ncbi:MAG: hypothetical protein INR71_06020 [Terriglobus roseus]|nr:hypothetical protein [Terriglobus roseus]
MAVTGYLKELQAPQYFDGLIEKPPTLHKLTDVISRLCQWKPPPPDWTPAQLPAQLPSSLRQESMRSDDSPVSNSSSFPTGPSSSWRGSSREDSISSSFFGDVDSRSDDISLSASRQATDEWRDQQFARAIGGLGISEMAELETKSLPPDMPHQSAPAALEHAVPRSRRSASPLNTKRRSVDIRVAHELADSGDDEDEVLGDAKLRTKSPKGRPRGSSKLGVEMMRTNSHGSVVSVEDIVANDTPVVPPPAIPENQTPVLSAHPEREGHATLTPPEMFPKLPGDDVKEIDIDATPKAHHDTPDTKGSPDPNPTPKPAVSPRPTPLFGQPQVEEHVVLQDDPPEH